MNWDTIDTVFFDMDGTLIDLLFEDTFWTDHLPACYATHYRMPVKEATHKLLTHNRAIAGTLDWYCLDYWDKYLGMNTVRLSHALTHLIRFRPHAQTLLTALKTSPITTAIITNAHLRSFALKNQQLNLSSYMDYVVSSHELGYPKEETRFWHALQNRHPFDPVRTLFIDDNLAVLTSAKAYGIQHLLAIPQPNSTRPPKSMHGFTELHDFRTLLPIMKTIPEPSLPETS